MSEIGQSPGANCSPAFARHWHCLRYGPGNGGFGCNTIYIQRSNPVRYENMAGFWPGTERDKTSSANLLVITHHPPQTAFCTGQHFSSLWTFCTKNRSPKCLLDISAIQVCFSSMLLDLVHLVYSPAAMHYCQWKDNYWQVTNDHLQTFH